MGKIDKNVAGIVLGIFFALIHAVWLLFVAITPMGLQRFITWVLDLHHIAMPFSIITPFNFLNALLLVIVTFVFGYIFGWVFAAVWDWKVHK